MAWSDAARAAALEMRRAHRKFKGESPPRDYRKERGWDVAGIYSKAQRRNIAAEIKAIRRRIRAGRLTAQVGDTAYAKSLLREAAVSTAHRNFMRRR